MIRKNLPQALIAKVQINDFGHDIAKIDGMGQISALVKILRIKSRPAAVNTPFNITTGSKPGTGIAVIGTP